MPNQRDKDKRVISVPMELASIYEIDRWARKNRIASRSVAIKLLARYAAAQAPTINDIKSMLADIPNRDLPR